MRWLKSFFLLIAAVIFGTTLYGSIDYASARLERRLKPTKTSDRIVIDGQLDEASWSQTDVAGNFIQNEPQVDQPASEATEVRVLYDHDNLYVGILARDSEPQRVIVNDLRKDFEHEQGDTVAIVQDTFHDQRNGYVFATNAAGAKWDAQATNEGRQLDENWDGIWTVKTRTNADGWVAEIAIPFKTLKFREMNVQTWGINFQRRLRRKNEDSFWSPLPRIYDMNGVSLAGTLENLVCIQPGSSIRVKPYA
ncbi:MAG: carbohydrate binding family 9 domain-containing protein, partial [Terriglobia bacterium]